MKTIKSGQIEMYIRRPERKHWGNYKITARNCVGSKNVTTAINILDIPSLGKLHSSMQFLYQKAKLG